MAPRKNAKPKTRASGTMTESAFWSFIRSALRAKSRRWLPVYKALEKARVPNKTDNKKLKWNYRCAECGEYFPATQVTVDHIIPCGSLKSGKDLEGFVARLFCEPEGLQVLDLVCHAKKTAAEKAERIEKDKE